MNIFFFLTPKEEVCYIHSTDTMAQAIDKVLRYGYTTIPVLSRETGRYEGSLAADDLLRALMNDPEKTVESSSCKIVRLLSRRRDYEAVRADCEIEDLLHYAETQNFVPVTDDTGAFIGIITRQKVMRYLEQGQNES